MDTKIYPEIDTMVSLYLEGAPIKELAARFGGAKETVRDALSRKGVAIRPKAEAIRVGAQWRRQQGHVHGLTGRAKTWSARSKRALSLEKSLAYQTDTESLVADWLLDLGHLATPQRAHGIYNVDLAVGNIIIEIYGNSWHASGDTRERSYPRYRYLLGLGLNAVVVWTDDTTHPLSAESAEYISDYIEYCADNPEEQGRFRSIRGNGSEAYRGGLDDLDLLVIYPNNRD